MMNRIRVREESAVRKLVAYLLLFWGIPSLMLAEDIGWPREMTQNGAQIIYYQPQIDSWRDYRTLDARMAISGDARWRKVRHQGWFPCRRAPMPTRRTALL